MSLRTLSGLTPKVHSTAFVAPTAEVIGAVEVGDLASIWYGAVLRGDINQIVVGDGSNVQDNAVVHVADEYPAIIGRYTTVGHSAVVHACTIGDECLIGMGSIILDGAVIGDRCVVGAGALVTGGTVVPPGSMVLGAPARVVRPLREDEREGLRHWAEKYVGVSRRFMDEAGEIMNRKGGA